ncbi:MAG: aminoacetone oxidase family FAD-binding enzyme, partial [Clostridia bacterium]|nr:aminoacetone oxidase family FAD-binding enzyme [Clostridia bacterium]
KASDVNRTLSRIMQQAGVKVLLDCRVKAIHVVDGRAAGVVLQDGTTMAADAVILATGGKSYPMTGSTGDGYAMAESVGHSIQPIKAALSAIETRESWPWDLQGLSLRNVSLTLKKGKKTLYTELGEMLFTHFGISGPLALTMSCHLPDDLSEASVTISLKPGLTAQQLDARLQRDFEEQSRKQLRNVMPGLLPGRLAEIFPGLCGIDSAKQCCQITRQERETLCTMMQALPITLARLTPLDEAIVTRGGVTVKEINPATMESKLLPGLYFAGEVMDVDAHTGGYNLQIAWSTGALAGQSAAEHEGDYT